MKYRSGNLFCRYWYRENHNFRWNLKVVFSWSQNDTWNDRSGACIFFTHVFSLLSRCQMWNTFIVVYYWQDIIISSLIFIFLTQQKTKYVSDRENDKWSINYINSYLYFTYRYHMIPYDQIPFDSDNFITRSPKVCCTLQWYSDKLKGHRFHWEDQFHELFKRAVYKL